MIYAFFGGLFIGFALGLCMKIVVIMNKGDEE